MNRPNLPEVLRRRADEKERAMYSYMRDPASDVVDDTISTRGLDVAARRIAVLLSQSGVRPGDRVLLVLPGDLEFVRAFFGCLYAGVVAVPTPPAAANQKAGAERSASILVDAEPAAVLCRRADVPEVRGWLSALGRDGIRCIALDDAAEAPEGTWREPRVTPDMLAFLQYTSGSTQEPKGVMVSHGNLVANLESIRRWLDADESTRMLSWLPLIHDMGLIGKILGTSFFGGQLMLLPPGAFVRRPYQWLRQVDRFGARISGAPNFAYEWCVRRVTEEQVSTLDLSRWECAFNGAEPVQARTMAAFTARFARAGFAPTAFTPCYGLAEATLFVSGSPLGRGPSTATVDTNALAHRRFLMRDPDGEAASVVAGSGRVMGTETVIVDPATREPVPAGLIGEIWLRGDSVAGGYWRRDELNAELFDATTSDGRSGFLRSGDLGVLRDSELYVVGRLKDVMVIRGRNLYPQDLELASGSADPERCTGLAAAFTLSETSDDVIVVQEVRPPTLADDGAASAVARIRDAIVREHGIKPPSVVLVRPGGVLRTTSGKVRRSQMREMFLGAGLEVLHEDLTGTARSVRAGKQITADA